VRTASAPDKDELLKTEMKIQDQINHWMQAKKQNQKEAVISEEQNLPDTDHEKTKEDVLS
jgi:hypothetical protein